VELTRPPPPPRFRQHVKHDDLTAIAAGVAWGLYCID
jgi:hypothetical protein